MKDLKKLAKQWRDRIAPTMDTVRPYVNAVDRIAMLAVHMQKITPLGVIGLAARGVNTFAERGAPPALAYGYSTLLSSGQLTKAIEAAGGTVEPTIEDERFTCKLDGFTFSVNHSNVYGNLNGKETIAKLSQAVDASLPPSIEVRTRVGREGQASGYECHAYELTNHVNAQGTEIANATLPLLEGGRCILLDGKPGVGKTTLAQIIARESKLGRTVLLPGSILGNAYHDDEYGSCSPSRGVSVRASFELMSAGVIIVDDIDKIRLSLETIEALRASAKLVILTANNGQYDGVLDGALMRAGRVDEVFSIKPIALPREVPFDQLTDDEWGEVSEWPVAYVNEVRKRLQHRPHDVRLADLRERLTRRTRSGSELL